MVIYSHIFIMVDSHHCKVFPALSFSSTRNQIRFAYILWSWGMLHIFCYLLRYDIFFSLQTAAGTKDPLFKRSWIWATWVVSPVNIKMNHCVLSRLKWLIGFLIFTVLLVLARLCGTWKGMKSWSSFGQIIKFVSPDVLRQESSRLAPDPVEALLSLLRHFAAVLRFTISALKDHFSTFIFGVIQVDRS